MTKEEFVAVRDEAFNEGDVFIDYPQEDMMFRFEKASGRVFRRFAGADDTEDELPYSLELFAEACRYGTETDAAHYAEGLTGQ